MFTLFLLVMIVQCDRVRYFLTQTNDICSRMLIGNLTLLLIQGSSPTRGGGGALSCKKDWVLVAPFRG